MATYSISTSASSYNEGELIYVTTTTSPPPSGTFYGVWGYLRISGLNEYDLEGYSGYWIPAVYQGIGAGGGFFEVPLGGPNTSQAFKLTEDLTTEGNKTVHISYLDSYKFYLAQTASTVIDTSKSPSITLAITSNQTFLASGQTECLPLSSDIGSCRHEPCHQT